jgi:hypothetical protein
MFLYTSLGTDERKEVGRAQLEGAAKDAWDQTPKVLRNSAYVHYRGYQAWGKSFGGSVLRNVVGDDSGGLLRTLGLRLDHDRTKIEPQAENPLQNMVAGPGFEPGTSRL